MDDRKDEIITTTPEAPSKKYNVQISLILTKDFNDYITNLEILSTPTNLTDEIKDDGRNTTTKNNCLNNKLKRPKAGQISLVLVFDGTGSMFHDLNQLRTGAKTIIEKFSNRDDNTIHNYIFVPFRDPHINEFLEGGHNCRYQSEICINKIGNFTCTLGYESISHGQQCLDINECSQGIHTCSHICENVLGSYKCKCPYNLKLSTDGYNCIDTTNTINMSNRAQHDSSDVTTDIPYSNFEEKPFITYAAMI